MDALTQDKRDEATRRATDIAIRRVGWFVAKLLFFVFIFLPLCAGFLFALLPDAVGGWSKLTGG